MCGTAESKCFRIQIRQDFIEPVAACHVAASPVKSFQCERTSDEPCLLYDLDFV